MNKLENFRIKLKPTNIPIDSKILDLAKEVLHKNDFPTTKNEKWKYTRLGRLSKLKPDECELFLNQNSLEKISENAITIEINNGYFNFISEIPAGIKIKSLKDCSKNELSKIGKNLQLENEIFHSLNSLYLNDGVYIEIDRNIKIDKEIHLLYNTQGINQYVPSRIFIQCNPFSETNIVEFFKSDKSSNSFINPITETVLEQNAKLNITKIQIEDGDNFHIGSDYISQQSNSYFKCNTISLKGEFIRNNIHVNVNGKNCQTDLNGAYLIEGKQHIDNHTKIEHCAPQCESNELYKGILDDKSTGVFNGKVIVHPDAQKINAFQSNANVLISDNANVNSKPELEIYADDVKCSHGSTTGQLDENAIYYLRSRGISKRKAQTIISQSFIKDVFTKIESPITQSFIYKKLEELHNWEYLDK